MKSVSVTKLAPQGLIKYHAHKALAGYRPGRSHKTVHASDVTDPSYEFCPREYALRDLSGAVPESEFLSTSQQVVFAIGNSLQEWVTRDVLKGVAVTDWKCLACGTMVVLTALPEKCVACGCRGFKPVEHRFVSKKSGISCGIDTLVRLDGPKLVAVECKTMGLEEFKKLAMPLAEHAQRTKLYMRIIDESDDPARERIDTSKAHVLYITKEGYGTQASNHQAWGFMDGKWSPFREYIVTRDDKAVEALVAKAATLNAWRESLDTLETKPMPSRICPTPFCKRATSCKMVHACFNTNQEGSNASGGG